MIDNRPGAGSNLAAGIAAKATPDGYTIFMALTRDRMTMTEEPRYTTDFYDPDKRSSANAVQVWFKDGSSTPKAEVDYPLGHVRRRAEALPALQAKLVASLARRFPPDRCARIQDLCADGARFDATPVNTFIDLLVGEHPC